MTTWRKLITKAMKEGNTHWNPKTSKYETTCIFEDSWGNFVHCTLSAAELDVEFDNGFGGAEGKPFTLWTKTRVYFPVVYDGAESVASVPRDPCDEARTHVGG